MIFQVVALVDDTLVLVVIITIVCCTVDNVSDSDVLKYLSILSNKISTKVKIAIYDLRADPLVELVLVLFSGGASKVKIFIVQLLRCDQTLSDPLRVGLARTSVHAGLSITLTLALAAWRAKLVLVLPLAAPTHIMVWSFC